MSLQGVGRAGVTAALEVELRRVHAPAQLDEPSGGQRLVGRLDVADGDVGLALGEVEDLVAADELHVEVRVLLPELR